MYKPKMSERTTAIVSALLALGILGLGVTAQPTGDRTSRRLESLESDLRFQIAMAWRHEGRTREARESQLDEVLEAWRASPQTEADQQLLQQWMRDAILSSLPGESGEFPPAPTFSPRIEANELAPPRDEEVQSPAPESSVPPATGASSLPRDVELKPGQAYTPPRAKEVRIAPRPPAGEKPSVQAAQDSSSRKPESTPPSQAAPAVTAQPKQRLAAKPVAPPVSPARVERPREPATAAVQPNLSKQPPLANHSGANASHRSIPVESETRQPDQQRREELPSLEETPVMVNLAELNAQINGYHVGLNEVEARVVARRGRLTVGDVAKLVGQLEQLTGQYQFIRLYYDGLTPRERRLVASPRSMMETISLVEAERAALVAEEEDFLTTLQGAAEEDDLARRLQALAEAAADEDR
jgi:hypothetical protein